MQELICKYFIFYDFTDAWKHNGINVNQLLKHQILIKQPFTSFIETYFQYSINQIKLITQNNYYKRNSQHRKSSMKVRMATTG